MLEREISSTPSEMPMKDQKLFAYIEGKSELCKSYDYRSADGFSSYVGDDFPLYNKLPAGVAIPENTDGRVRGTDDTKKPTYSSYKSRDVFETIEKYLPYLLRSLGQSKELISIIPNKPNDEKQARKEARALNFMVLKSNKYYSQLHDFLKNFFIYRNAYMEVDVVQKMEVTSNMDLFPPEIVEQMEQNNAFTIINKKERTQGIAVEFIERKSIKELMIRCIPNERMRIDNEHDEVNLDNCKFVEHTETLTRSDLRSMGYSDEFVDYSGQTSQHSDEQDINFEPEKLERDSFTGDFVGDYEQYTEDDNALSPVTVKKTFCRYDYDQDGFTELIKVVRTDWKILEVKIVNMIPYISAAAIMIPNEHVGMSMAETLKPIEAVNDNLFRRMFNNIHRSGISRKYINMDAMTHGDTLDAMVNSESQVVPINTWGGKITDVIYSDPVQPITQEISAVIGLMKEIVASRSGVNAQDSPDPQTLQRSTQGAYMEARDDSMERPGALIRTVAEVAIKPLFVKVHYLLRRNPELLTMVRNAGMWEEADPSTWPDRKDMMVSVGLAQLNRQQLQAFLFNFFNIMKELPDTLVNEEKIFNALSDYLHSGGVEDSTEYIINPENEEEKPPPPEPDPQTLLIAAQTELVKKQAESEPARLQLEEARQQREEKEANEKVRLENLKREDLKEEKEDKLELEREKLAQTERQNDLKETELDYKYAIDKEKNRLLEDKQDGEHIKIPEEIEKIESEVDKLQAEIDNIDKETSLMTKETETTNE